MDTSTTITSITTTDTTEPMEDSEDEPLGLIVTNKKEAPTRLIITLDFATCEPHCGPTKWLTTAKGETRDFFRILKSYN